MFFLHVRFTTLRPVFDRLDNIGEYSEAANIQVVRCGLMLCSDVDCCRKTCVGLPGTILLAPVESPL
nr:hypothetical protein CFP56_34652 [Quercus suber]